MLYGEASFEFQDIQILNIAKRRQNILNAAQQRECKRKGIPANECSHVTFLDTMQAYSFAIKPGHDKVLRRMLKHAKAKRAKAEIELQELIEAGADMKNQKRLRRDVDRFTKRANNLRKRLRRWKQVQDMPWGDYDGWPSNYNKERCNKKWATIRELVIRWNNGEIRDACPNTTHWGGRKIDPVQPGYKEEPCHNTAGGLLPQKTETVNAMLKQTGYRGIKRHRSRGRVIDAQKVKKAFQNGPLTFTNIR